MQQERIHPAHLIPLHAFTQRVLLGLTLLLGLAVTEGICALLLAQEQYRVAQSAQHTQQDIDLLFSAMLDQETGLRGYITTADPIFLEPYYQGKYRYENSLPRLQEHLQFAAFSNVRGASIHFVTTARAWSNTFAARQLMLMQDQKAAQARSLREGLQGKMLFDHFRRAAEEFREIVRTDAERAEVQSLQLNSVALLILILIILCSLLLLGGRTYQHMREMQWQLQEILAAMNAWEQGAMQRRVSPLRYLELQQIAQGVQVMVDRLEERRAEVERQRLGFQMLADTLPQVIWIAHANGRVDYYNQRWYEYTGRSLEQTQGWEWRSASVVHPDDLSLIEEVWQAALAQGSCYELQLRLKRGCDGTFHWHLARALPLKDRQGRVLQWFGTLTDIDALKEAERVLLEASEAQHRFISIVSHEFRTSLTSIQGFSEMLWKEAFSETEVKEFAGDMYRDATRLNRMISDLLDLEKMQSGRMSLCLEEVKLQELLGELAEKMPALSARHELVLHLDSDMPPIQADRDKLFQAFYNLLTNAVKYSPEGGMIVLEMRGEAARVHLSFCDQGIGIPAEAVDAIFRPYNRVEVRETRYIKGTGLGLPIVRSLLELHGGQVWVESVLGQGSCFHILLPTGHSEVDVVIEVVKERL